MEVEVENTGDRAGDEVVLLYLQDVYASVTRPVKELKGFQRVPSRRSRRKSCASSCRPRPSPSLTPILNPVIEPGEFRLSLGVEGPGKERLGQVAAPRGVVPSSSKAIECPDIEHALSQPELFGNGAGPVRGSQRLGEVDRVSAAARRSASRSRLPRTAPNAPWATNSRQATR